MSWLTHWVPSLSLHRCSSASPETLHKSQWTLLAQSMREVEKNAAMFFLCFILRHATFLLRRPAEHFSAYSRVLLFLFLFFFLFFSNITLSQRFSRWCNWKPLPGDGPQGSGVVLPAITATNRGGKVNTQRFNNSWMFTALGACPRPRWRLERLARSASSASRVFRRGRLEISSSVKGDAYRRQE